MKNLEKKTISEITKNFWQDQKNYISLLPLYKKRKVIYLLNENKELFFGKSGNRKCIKFDPVLYKSIMVMTKCLDLYHYKINFSGRLIFLIEHNGKLKKLKCIKCKKTFFKYDNFTKKFNIMFDKFRICPKCRPSSNSKLYFIYKYGTNWKNEWESYWKNSSIKSNLGKSGFVYRNGYEEGIRKYNEYWDSIWKSRNNRFYSKISQELFWNIFNKLEDKESIYFAELSGEWFEKIDNENINQTVYFIDFKYKNKIIEYDCDYWHNDINDKIRDDYLLSKGYKILRVTNTEFNRNYKPTDVINKCLDFLKDN